MVINQISITIKNRISTNSFNKIKFAKSLPIYNQASWKSGYKTELTFNPNLSYMKSSYHRKWNIIWFNPPFNNQVSTNIGTAFFHLLRKHFLPNHRLYKMCNKNIIKFSYSCILNMGNIIHSCTEQEID